MFEITYSNAYYHIQDLMILWCKEHIGHGGWEYIQPSDDRLWTVRCEFGQTTFSFVKTQKQTIQHHLSDEFQ